MEATGWSYHRALETLPSLETDQLVEMKKRIEVLLSYLPCSDASGGDWSMLVFGRLSRLLADRGYARITPFNCFNRTRHWPTFRKGADDLGDFIEGYFSPPTRVKKIRSLDLCLDLIADWLRSRGEPVSLGRMTSSLGQVTLAVDKAFPGYRRSGLLVKLIG